MCGLLFLLEINGLDLVGVGGGQAGGWDGMRSEDKWLESGKGRGVRPGDGVWFSTGSSGGH